MAHASAAHSTPGPWRAAYAAETDPTIRSRVRVGVAVYLPAAGAFGVLELLHYPERAAWVATRYAIELLACGLALLALRRRPVGTGGGATVASVLMAAIALVAIAYNAAVHAEAERYANGQILQLSALVILMPWGWRAQLRVAAVTVVGFLAVSPWLTSDAVSYPALALFVGAGISVCGAFYIDRYRFDAFRRTALQQEEAEIARALLRVGDSLSAHLHRPDMLEQVNHLAVETLGCDASLTFVWETARDAFVLGAAVGIEQPEVRTQLASIVFGRDSLPIVGVLRPRMVTEVNVRDERPLLPIDLMRRWNVSALLAAPIARGDGIVGVLLCSYRTRTEPFTLRQHRLALGIAHATAMALENARLIADLQTASRLKTEFVSTMSHELRTPLNVILGFAEMARDGAFDLAARETFLERIEAAARDLLQLVEDTLEMGRIESGRDDVRLEPVQLPALWAALHEKVRRLPCRDAVSLEWSGDVPAVSLVTDPRKLSIVVCNLVGNALKFTEAGSVRGDVTATDDAVVLRIADTGVGIRPEDQRVIFEMFRQADGSDSRRYGGVGLGLHIVRRYVEQLGGVVEVESVPGAGSTFSVRLPLSAAPVRQAA